MIEHITPSEYLNRHRDQLLIDVRSPAEYAHGHIPGAVNLPLFSDEERAIVGTLYKKEGRAAAVQKGLTFVSPHLNEFIEKATSFIQQLPEKNSRMLTVYCARGGMRSRSLAMLFECAHFHVFQLVGGYKAYKAHLRAAAQEHTNIVLLGGKTGAGKTAILQELAQLGEQILDLEGEACHRGSTYGALGQKMQPSQEQFMVTVLTKLALFNHQKPVWIEHEGNRLGNLFVPQELWNNMLKAPIILINLPAAYRKKRLIEEYGSFNPTDLITCTALLEQRLGGEMTKKICAAIKEGEVEQAVTLLMDHYDRSYAYATERDRQYNVRKHIPVDLEGTSPKHHAKELINLSCSLR